MVATEGRRAACHFGLLQRVWFHFSCSSSEKARMDALALTPGELLCLGSSLAFSGLFYYLHRKKAKVVAKIQVCGCEAGLTLPDSCRTDKTYP